MCNISAVEIVWTAAATRQWLKLSANVRRRLEAKLLTYAQTGQGDVRWLREREGARLRLGEWRMIFYVEDNIIVVAVGHRREIYD